MERNEKLGGIVALIGGLMGVIGHFMIFLNWYFRGMAAEAAEPGCEILLKWIHPALTDLGIFGGILFLVSSYGFFTKQKWAFFLSVLGIVISLQGAWFINVPFMAAGLPPVYFTLFWPFLILYFLIMVPIGKLSWGQTMVIPGWYGLGILFNEWHCQSEPDHHCWGALLRTGAAFTLGRHARLGRIFSRIPDAAKRMDAGGWPGRRHAGTGGWDPIGVRHSTRIGTLLIILVSPDLLPDPGRSVGLARYLGKV